MTAADLVACAVCGRPLKARAARDAGMGRRCAKKRGANLARLAALTGSGTPLLFPDVDRPLIEQARKDAEP